MQGTMLYSQQQGNPYNAPMAVGGYNIQAPNMGGYAIQAPSMGGPAFVDDDGNEYVLVQDNVGGPGRLARKARRQERRDDRKDDRIERGERKEGNRDLDELQRLAREGDIDGFALFAATLPDSVLQSRPSLRQLAASQLAKMAPPPVFPNQTRQITNSVPGQAAIGTPLFAAAPPVPDNTLMRPFVFPAVTAAGNTIVTFSAQALIDMWIEEVYLGIVPLTGSTSEDAYAMSSLSISGAEYITNKGSGGGIPGSRLNKSVQPLKLGGQYLKNGNNLTISVSGVTALGADTAKVYPMITAYGLPPSA